jgi:shikimate kinase
VTTVAHPSADDTVAAGSHAVAQGRFLARSVAIVGFMGVGKTAVGRELARLLDRPFVDTDETVQARSGRSIPELFAEGEPVFRRLEYDAVAEALDAPPCVIALGGGAFSQPACAGLLLAKALVVHLYTPWSVILGLLGELALDRPLVRGRQPWQVQDLFLARSASYRRAHVRVCPSREGPDRAAASVAAVLWRPAARPDPMLSTGAVSPPEEDP